MTSNLCLRALAATALGAMMLVCACGSDDGSDDDADDDGAGGATGSGASTGSGSGIPSCDEACVGVMAANCANGPPDEAACVQGCEDVRSGPCNAQYETLADCAGSEPDYACDQGGYVTVTGCEAENTALSTCLASGG